MKAFRRIGRPTYPTELGRLFACQFEDDFAIGSNFHEQAYHELRQLLKQFPFIADACINIGH
jgi:hypothetical protein